MSPLQIPASGPAAAAPNAAPRPREDGGDPAEFSRVLNDTRERSAPANATTAKPPVNAANNAAKTQDRAANAATQTKQPDNTQPAGTGSAEHSDEVPPPVQDDNDDLEMAAGMAAAMLTHPPVPPLAAPVATISTGSAEDNTVAAIGGELVAATGNLTGDITVGANVVPAAAPDGTRDAQIIPANNQTIVDAAAFEAQMKTLQGAQVAAETAEVLAATPAAPAWYSSNIKGLTTVAAPGDVTGDISVGTTPLTAVTSEGSAEAVSQLPNTPVVVTRSAAMSAQRAPNAVVPTAANKGNAVVTVGSAMTAAPKAAATAKVSTNNAAGPLQLPLPGQDAGKISFGSVKPLDAQALDLNSLQRRDSRDAAVRRALEPLEHDAFSLKPEISADIEAAYAAGSRSFTNVVPTAELKANALEPARELMRATLEAIPKPLQNMNIQIKPEGFGTINIRIYQTPGPVESSVWRMEIRATDPAARALLSNNLAELRHQLKIDGVTVQGGSNAQGANNDRNNAGYEREGGRQRAFQENQKQGEREPQEAFENFFEESRGQRP